MKKILYLLNPKSNNDHGKDLWEKAHKRFPQLPEKPTLITEIDDISKYIKEQSPDIVVIAGGDGTINAICQAVLPLKQKPVLTILPMGTGNALSYCLGVETLEKSMTVLQRPAKQITIDLIQTNIKKHSIGVLNISAGFDARIVFNHANYRYIGIPSYLLSGLRSIFSHPEKEITFTIDKKVTLQATASSLFVANSQAIGQNVVISPHAKLNDGLLDCTLFSTKYAYLRNLRLRGFRHPFYTELGKVHFKASSLSIQGEPFVQIDGDSVLWQDSLEIEVMPKAVTFLRNNDKQIDQYYLPFVV